MERRKVIIFSFGLLIIAAAIILLLTVLLQKDETDSKGVELQRGYNLKVRKNCKNGKKWLYEDAVVYKPDFFNFKAKQLTNDTDMQKFLVTAELGLWIFPNFQTLIIDCPYLITNNYTESDLHLITVLSEQKRTEYPHGNMTPAIWLQFNHRTSRSLPSCVDLAKVANAMQQGTITGIIITDDILLMLSEEARLMDQYFVNDTNNDWWSSGISKMLYTWKIHGLKTGLAISTMYCFSFEDIVPEKMLTTVDSVFFLEETHIRVIVANQTPFLKLSEDFLACQDFVQKKFTLRLVVAEKDVPRRAFSHPYCLL